MVKYSVQPRFGNNKAFQFRPVIFISKIALGPIAFGKCAYFYPNYKTLSMKTLTLISVFVLISSFAISQQFTVLSESEEQIHLRLSTQQIPFAYTTIDGVEHIDFAKSFPVVMSHIGAPALPLFSTNIELPNLGNPTVQVLYTGNFLEMSNVRVAPSKGNLKRNVDPSLVPYVFGEYYQTNQIFPQDAHVHTDPFIMRDLRGLTIQLSPYQYNPITKKLVLYQELTVVVSYNKEVEGINEKTFTWNDPISKLMQTSMFLNKKDLRYSVKDEEGEMLIITHPDFENEIMPFANWKNQKGIRTTVVNSDDAGTNAANIKSFIGSYFDENPNTLYLVLVGDHQQIPAHSYGSSGGEQLWSDTYYGQLLGDDHYPELFVGRISGTTSAHIRTQVERTLEYEKLPKEGDWMEKAAGIGSNEGAGYGNLGLADWDHLRQMRTKLMDFGYTTVHEFYEGSQGGEDASGNPTVQMLQTAFNDGLGLWNYTGHGWENGMSTCNYTGADANNASNYGMYPLVISVACNNGTFTNGTCVGEDFLRANTGGTKGAIGFAGSTILMSWAPPMQTQWEMTNILTEQDPNNVKRTVGGLFYNGQISMMSQYPGNAGHEVMRTWAYFGDPSLLFRHKQTLPLPINHNMQIADAATSIQVNSDVEGARIAISQDNVLLGYGFIENGTVTVNFSALTSNQPLIVTATKQNHIAKQQVVQVGNGPLGLNHEEVVFQAYPNPANNMIHFNVSLTQEVVFEVINVTGQVLSSEKMENTTWSYAVNDLPQGLYFARIIHASGVQTVPFQVMK